MSSDADRSSKCREAILSEEVTDFFISLKITLDEVKELYNPECIQVLDKRYSIVHIRENLKNVQMYNYIYSSFPKCYGLMEQSNMEYIGVQRARRSTSNLLGNDVIIGFVDTGIDYQHEVFKMTDGTSRIVSIWDQTIQTGISPEGYYYGSEYTQETINEALRREDPLTLVPSVDTNGHGTFMAGIAAGNIDKKNDFTGVAPQAEIAMVKLKPAKQYLRDYYYIRNDVECFQETDLLLGCSYLLQLAQKKKKSLVICIGVGTSSGGHDGSGILDEYLEVLADEKGVCIVTPTGNEANNGGHFRGNVPQSEDYVDVELNIGAGEKGFVLEFWAKTPSLFSIGFITPSGEVIQKVPPRINNNEVISFLFDATVIYVDYRIVESRTGDLLIFMRFQSPMQGIWKLRIYREESFIGDFDLWLPIRQFMTTNTYFLTPDPYTTITDPGNCFKPITAAACNHTNNSIYINSGRGYTRRNRIKPDITAPGVNIFGPLPDNTFGTKTGTSVAAAHVAGAAALLLEWAVKNNFYYNSTSVKTLMIKGAKREGRGYPNREWGYGTLDIAGAFDSIRYTI